MRTLQIAAWGISLICCACNSGSKNVASDNQVAIDTVPEVVFDGDSAYANVKRVVDFGPRVPGTAPHVACGEYITAQLNAFGADTVITQEGMVTAFNGDRLPYKNILARYNSGAPKRVLLLTHWDTRPWADQETRLDDRSKPVLGANDGGSGVGVLLEVARLLNKRAPEVGVDLLFVDAEDYGRSDGWSANEDTWCLGTQEWLKAKPYNGSVLPVYGILLDMVGAQGAVFYREFTSQRIAKPIVDKVWSRALSSGYGDRFVNEVGTAITDDHTFINRAGIPCIDIIECMNPTTKSFHPSWHTLSDDMEVIDPATLKAVGQVVLNVIYNEPV